jgi:alkanesulfonate monooxygenase SsuD/methylene tetrahydromethanopterin reductase-like flavin-dependent oxidoreductase (luciferase family)
MKVIWREENAAYHGELVNFDPIWSWPKPQQKPHPPILLGGHGPKALKRVVDYCDGWMPIAPLAGDLVAGVKDLRSMAEKAGRNPKSISISAFWAPPDEGTLGGYAEAGVGRAIFALPPASRDEVLPIVDRYAKLVR